MKKILCLILAVAMLLGMTACGKPQEEAAPAAASLSVGYYAVDISPTESLPLDGYAGTQWEPATRWSNGVDWPLYAIAIAITDANGETVMIVALDMLLAFMADAMRQAIEGATGVPKENIFFHCTHNHNGVALRINEPPVVNYTVALTENVQLAAKEAMNDRKTVTEFSTTFARAEDIATVRHYLTSDGEYMSSNKSEREEGVTWYGHTTVADNMIQLAKFTREGGKDVLLMNYQGHLCASGISLKLATSDYAGVMRNYVETELDCLSMFIQGGGGNLGMGTQLKDEVLRADSRDYKHLGRTLGADAVAVADTFQPIVIDNIQHKEQMTFVDTRDGGKQKVFLNAFTIGEFALVSAPFEIFDTNAMYVRENSPYKMTFYSSCTNGSNQYLATSECFDWRYSYEAFGSIGAKGAAEAVQDELLGMLNTLYGTDKAPIAKPEGYIRGEYEPETNGVTYTIWKYEDGSVMKPVKNDFQQFYGINENGDPKVLLVKDTALAEQIAGMESAKFLFDHQNVIVGIAE